MRKLAWALLLLAMPAWSADLAVLRNGFSIRHDRREQIGSITRLYMAAPATGYVDVQTDQIDHFDQDLIAPDPPAPSVPAKANPLAVSSPPTLNLPLSDVVAYASLRNQVDPDLIKSVIHAESNFNVHAVSPKGAQGLMQLMPQTASVLGVSNAFDPAANVDGGTRYLRMLLEKYNFDLVKALAAYNAGPQRVEKYRGVPPYYETQAYIARIIRDFNQKKLAEQKAAAAAARAQAASARTLANKTPARRPAFSLKSTEAAAVAPLAR